MHDPAHLRKSYQRQILEQDDLTPEPMDLFRKWWHEAIDNEISEANAMTLATVDPMGRPSARIVLLKGLTHDGLEFYTHYGSRKATDMEQNPNVALVFFWKEMERQIRIEGIVEKLPASRSTSYFQSRPRGSQVGAWSSPQSLVIPNRSALDELVSRIEEKFEGIDPLPRPDNWGGYNVRPACFEFWQGRPDRMHDRFRYSRSAEDSDWKIERLAP